MAYGALATHLFMKHFQNLKLCPCHIQSGPAPALNEIEPYADPLAGPAAETYFGLASQKSVCQQHEFESASHHASLRLTPPRPAPK